jgi:hypothetical protein
MCGLHEVLQIAPLRKACRGLCIPRGPHIECPDPLAAGVKKVR